MLRASSTAGSRGRRGERKGLARLGSREGWSREREASLECSSLPPSPACLRLRLPASPGTGWQRRGTGRAQVAGGEATRPPPPPPPRWLRLHGPLGPEPLPSDAAAPLSPAPCPSCPTAWGRGCSSPHLQHRGAQPTTVAPTRSPAGMRITQRTTPSQHTTALHALPPKRPQNAPKPGSSTATAATTATACHGTAWPRSGLGSPALCHPPTSSSHRRCRKLPLPRPGCGSQHC